MKKFLLMFAVLLAATSAFVLTSCSEDDEPSSNTYIYCVGFTQFSGMGDDLSEMTVIDGIYQKALIKAVGVFDRDFTLKGSQKDCDDKVRSACEEAQKEVEKTDWKCSFTYTVTQVNNEKVVYQYSYTAK